MRIDLAVMADYASVTQDGKLVIAGVFTRIVALRMPWQHPMMSLVFRVDVHAGEPRDHEVRVTCIDPDGKEILPPIQQHITVGPETEATESSANLIFAAGGVSFQRSGRYSFEVFVDGEHAREVPFEVVVIPQAEPAAGSRPSDNLM